MSGLTGNCEEPHAFSSHLFLDPRCLSHARWMGTWERIRFTVPSGQMCAWCCMNVPSFCHCNNHSQSKLKKHYCRTIQAQNVSPTHCATTWKKKERKKETFMTYILQKKVKIAHSHSQCVTELSDPSHTGRLGWATGQSWRITSTLHSMILQSDKTQMVPIVPTFLEFTSQTHYYNDTKKSSATFTLRCGEWNFL